MLAAFRSSPAALDQVSIDQFEEWMTRGMEESAGQSLKSRRSYYALETRGSNERLHQVRVGLPLESIQTVLRIYIEGLTGKEVEVAPQSAMPQQSRIGDGKTIFLPATVAEFDDEEMDFRLYKVLAADGAGQIEFGTFEQDSNGLKAALASLSQLYEASADAIDAFSLSGYIQDVQKGEADVAGREALRKRSCQKVPITVPVLACFRAAFGPQDL